MPEGPGLIPGHGNKIPQAAMPKKKKHFILDLLINLFNFGRASSGILVPRSGIEPRSSDNEKGEA